MVFRRSAFIAVSLFMFAAPAVSFAQTTPTSTVVVTTVAAPGVSMPATSPIVRVVATAPSLVGVSNNNSNTITYAATFSGDTRTVTFVPGSYSVTASTNTSGYYLYYSGNCSGFTRLNGESVACTITLSTTPPPATTCIPGVYNASCVMPTIPYQGPYTPSVLSCSPSYQTIAAGQSATFVAAGGTPGSYTWSTLDRTTLNVGNSFTTVFQGTGVQSVMVYNGVQTANCTVNVVSTGAAITYPGIPSVISNYIPVTLPNTGFGPADSAMLAFALVLLVGAGIYVAPYVKKAVSIVLG